MSPVAVNSSRGPGPAILSDGLSDCREVRRVDEPAVHGFTRPHAMRTLHANSRLIVIRAAELSEIVDLRHAVLRQGLPRAEAIFAGDDAPTSRHYGAFCDGTAVGCATLH